MDLNESNHVLNPLLENRVAENKKLFLVEDFNIDLLKVGLDIPPETSPTIITSSPRTLIDKMY